MSCAIRRVAPPPKNRPLPVAQPAMPSSAKRPSAEGAEHAVHEVDGEGADGIVDLDAVKGDDGEDPR
jgi:hypothetical protein